MPHPFPLPRAHIWHSVPDMEETYDDDAQGWVQPPKAYPNFAKRSHNTRRAIIKNTERIRDFILSIKDSDGTELYMDLSNLLTINEGCYDLAHLLDLFHTDTTPSCQEYNRTVIRVLQALQQDGFLPSSHHLSTAVADLHYRLTRLEAQASQR